jgi:2-(1,2-epoxy-1,2-dihydrophenyl)acetyl-CoA isomerase
MLLVVERDPGIGCVVITGAGTAFCSGGDVSGMGGGAPSGGGASSGGGAPSSDAGKPSPLEYSIRNLQHRQETLTLRLHELAKPTIAALPGPAAGAGLSIALACDIRIAAESAFITTAFANIGVSGDYGGSWFLTQLVGSAKAKELYYTADRVSAEECLRLGIFNRVVPDAELPKQTRELAQQIASGPPIAHGFMKENLNRAVWADLKSCLAMEADRMARCFRTEDSREAVRAFMEKRKPEFKGV